MIRAGAPHFRHQQAIFVRDVVLEGDALRTQRPTADGMIGISLDVDDGGNGVLRPVTQGMDDDAARDGAVRTDAACLRGPRDFEGAHLGVRFGEVEAERNGPTDSRSFQKTTARKFH